MGSPSRAARRRAERAHRKNPIPTDGSYGVMAGWCAKESDLPALRTQLHDRLIDKMGDRRDGAVSWQWWEGDEARRVLGKLFAATWDPTMSTYYRRLGGLVRKYGGILCVAMAPGKQPARPPVL